MDNQHQNQIPLGLILALKFRNSALSESLKNDLEAEICELMEFRVICSTFERGIWRIRFPNEDVKVKFFVNMQQLLPRYPEIVIMSFNDVPAVRYETNISATKLTQIKVLTTIQRENAGIGASSWIVTEMTPKAHGVLVRLIVDAQSDEFIRERSGFLNFGTFKIFLRRIVNN
jgi:hypothetical protein